MRRSRVRIYVRPSIRDNGECPTGLREQIASTRPWQLPRRALVWAAVGITGIAVLLNGADDWFVDLLFLAIFLVAAVPAADRVVRRGPRSGKPPEPLSQGPPRLRLVGGTSERVPPCEPPSAAAPDSPRQIRGHLERGVDDVPDVAG
jgi:hypothetical protein